MKDPLISTHVNVNLTITQWLILVGWQSAHITADTPKVIRDININITRAVLGDRTNGT